MIRRRNVYRLACVVLAGFTASGPGCVSSQIDEGPEHPASPEATLAPLSPIGEALSRNDVPAPAGPDAPNGAPPEHHHGAHSGAAQEGSPSGGEASEPPMASDEAKQEWTCPMHPEVVQPQPGKCPKCGMKLVPLEPKKAH